jgi:hypothetical protein
MKRALFKLGSKFRIESKTENGQFVVEEDVDEWKTRPEWQFHFKEIKVGLRDVPPEDWGTIITVTSLQENVAQDFRLENFINELRLEIRAAQEKAMECGLAISLNGVPLSAHPMELLSSDILRAAFLEEKFTQSGGSVDVKIYAGISLSMPREAGWYIYCNGRMVMGADQTFTTGWGEGGEHTIPKYHNQFAMFRGFAFFDSDNAGLLPWNTTKTGVDVDSPVFRAVRLRMITLMRPVIDFLNALDAEKIVESDRKPLQKAVAKAATAPLNEVKTWNTFLSPKPTPRPPAQRVGFIQYNKPIEKIARVKKVLRVSSLKKVGEKTFDYFYQRECES